MSPESALQGYGSLLSQLPSSRLQISGRRKGSARLVCAGRALRSTSARFREPTASESHRSAMCRRGLARSRMEWRSWRCVACRSPFHAASGKVRDRGNRCHSRTVLASISYHESELLIVCVHRRSLAPAARCVVMNPALLLRFDLFDEGQCNSSGRDARQSGHDSVRYRPERRASFNALRATNRRDRKSMRLWRRFPCTAAKPTGNRQAMLAGNPLVFRVRPHCYALRE